MVSISVAVAAIGMLAMVAVRGVNGACDPDTEFECKNLKCIPLSLVNNSINDCIDNSDEAEYPCKAPLFSCSKSKRCVLMEWVLDGNDDCLDHSDEAKIIGTNCSSAVKCCFCHEFVPNSWCKDGICQCNNGYYSNNLGNECLARPVGGHCTVDDECAAVTLAICDATTSRCTCPNGFYSSKDGLECIKRQLGDECRTTDDCRPVIDNSWCNPTNFTCECDVNSGFYQQPNDTCQTPTVESDILCTSDLDCFSKHISTGRSEGVTCWSGNNTCRCSYGYVELPMKYDLVKKTDGYWVYQRGPVFCRHRRLYDQCDVTGTECLDAVPNSYCEPTTKICRCLDGYNQGTRNSTCLRLDAACHVTSVDDECADAIPASRCDPDEMRCVCNILYAPDDLERCIYRPIGGICHVNTDCFVPDSHCAFNRCTCDTGYYPVYDNSTRARCVRRVLGDSGCQLTADCNDVIENSDCINETCVCRIGYRPESPGRCIERLLDDNYTVCGDQIDCQQLFPNSFCTASGQFCQCKSGFRPRDSRKSCIQRRIGHGITDPPCRDNEDCFDAVANSVCDDKSLQCVCATGYYVSNDTVTGIGICQQRLIGDECSEDVDCSLLALATCRNNSAILDRPAVCACASGYGWTRDRRQCRKRRIGFVDDVSGCLSNSDCSDAVEHSVCRLGQCICQAGYRVASDGEECRLRILGDRCANDNDCQAAILHTVCVVTDDVGNNVSYSPQDGAQTGHCRCQHAFRMANDTTVPYCRPYVVGDDCKFDTECSMSVEFSWCHQNVCLCVSGYKPVDFFNSTSLKNDTICARRVIGDQCNLNSDCSDAVTFSECDVTDYACRCDEEHLPDVNGTECYVRPTLAPYIPVTGPEWAECFLDSVNSSFDVSTTPVRAPLAESTTIGFANDTFLNYSAINWQCGDLDDNEQCVKDRVTWSVASMAACKCRGGFVRRQPNEPCRRARGYELRLNCSLIAGRFELLPLVYENSSSGTTGVNVDKRSYNESDDVLWRKYGTRLQHDGVDVMFQQDERYVTNSLLSLSDAKPGLLAVVAVYFEFNTSLTVDELSNYTRAYFNSSEGEIGTSRIYVSQENLQVRSDSSVNSTDDDNGAGDGWLVADLNECSNDRQNRIPLNDCDTEATCGNIIGNFYFYCVCNIDFSDNSTDDEFGGRICAAIDKEKRRAALEQTFMNAGCSGGVCETSWDVVLVASSAVFSVLLVLLTIELIFKTRELRQHHSNRQSDRKYEVATRIGSPTGSTRSPCILSMIKREQVKKMREKAKMEKKAAQNVGKKPRQRSRSRSRPSGPQKSRSVSVQLHAAALTAMNPASENSRLSKLPAVRFSVPSVCIQNDALKP